MKKTVISLCIFVCMCTCVPAQLMNKNGYMNTVWSGAGNQNTAYKNELNGILNTFQARLAGVGGALVVDTMLQWAVQPIFTDSGDYDRTTFKNTKAHVNFILKNIKNLDLGMGTYLDWNIGPGPARGGKDWEIGSHCYQGGLSYGLPGSGSVAGAAYYANYITETPDTTKALAARFYIEDILQFAAGIPSGTDTDDFMINTGAKCTPNEKILFAAACNGLFKGDCNVYTGGSYIFTDAFSLHAWLALDNLAGKSNNGMTGTGAALDVNVNNFILHPEMGITFYENSDYTTAWYTGINLSYEISESFTAGLWSSFAVGSENRKWDDASATKNWTNGSIFDIRPVVTYYIKTADALAGSFEYQHVTTYQDKDYNYWSLGCFWVHIF